MLRSARGRVTAVASVFALGLVVGCKPAPEPLIWETVTGPEGLFEADVPTTWGAMVSEGSPRVQAFATSAAKGASHDPIVLQRNAMQEQSGLLLTFERIWRSAVSNEAWIAYISQRIELEGRTHNQLTDRAVVEHTHSGHMATLLVHHQSFGSRAYYELIRFEERQGILLTARLFVPNDAYLSHKMDLRARLSALDWDEVAMNEVLPRSKVPTVAVPSI